MDKGGELLKAAEDNPENLSALVNSADGSKATTWTIYAVSMARASNSHLILLHAVSDSMEAYSMEASEGVSRTLSRVPGSEWQI